MLRYYLPEIAKIFRIEAMRRNRVQHQKGLSDDAFERLYPDEEACRKAWFAWRWPEGFKCPGVRGQRIVRSGDVNLYNADSGLSPVEWRGEIRASCGCTH